jgi:RNA polymerase sigma-70 factor (ECF subfamily)
MPPDHPRTVETLLSQSDWVRTLVRGLGVDESGADDVLQSTWIAALTRPPRTAGETASFRAWIARVARNFALRRIDRDARRAGRERATAREERLPSAADVVEREEARAEVVRALLDVHEPFRTALLLRFYEGLEPRDIARLQNVPDSTVRNRLKRGLALLRERLEATQGPNWRQRCVLVLPALRPSLSPVPKLSKPVAAHAAPGGAVVIKSLGIATLTAALAGGVYIAWNRTETRRDLRVPSEALSRSSSSSSATTAAAAPSSRGSSSEHARRAGSAPQLVASAPASTRAPVGDASQEASAAATDDDGRRCTLRGRVLDPDGKPFHANAGEPVVLASELSPVALKYKVGLDGVIDREPAPANNERIRMLKKQAAESRIAERERAAREAAAALPAVAPQWAVVTDGTPRPTVEADKKRLAEVDQVLEIVNRDMMAKRSFAITLGFAPVPAHVLIASKDGDARELDASSDGSFEFGSLRPGPWRLFATAPGCLARHMEFVIGADESAKSLDVTLEPSKQLKVKLATPDGTDLLEEIAKDPNLAGGFQPIPFATRAAPGPRTPDLLTDPEHRFACGVWRDRHQLEEKVVGDASGALELTEALPLHVGVSVRGVVLEERAVQPETEEVVFVIPIDKIRAIASGVAVRIVAAGDGHPIAGASVQVAEFQGASTGEDGIAEIGDVPPGLRLLRYSAEGTETRAEWIRIDAGKRADLGLRQLDPAAPIHGRVLDENGDPVRGVDVLFHDLDGAAPGRALPTCETISTDEEGRFTFEKAGRRRYVPMIEGGDWASPVQTIDARGGPPAEVVMHARHNPGELKMTFPVEPPPGAYYVVETLDGIPVAVEPADGWRMLVVRLGDGAYRVRLVSDGRTLWTRQVHVHPGGMMAREDESNPR